MKLIKITILIGILGGLTLSPNLMSAKIEPDKDKDGLSDYEEVYVYKTDKEKKDTDGDGYNDGEEVFYGYSPKETNGAVLKKVALAVPYISEAPDGNWSGPWKNACEEATIAMAQYYYLGSKTVDKTTAKNYMWDLFTKQNQIYGSNADADSTRVAYLINTYGSFWAKKVNDPTLEQIKKELQQKRPVITFHYGFDLKNKNIPFLLSGSSYHVMTIIGYDDEKKQFLTNDPGDDYDGQNHRYDYSLFMNTIHDFDHNTGKANGKPVVIFTYPRLVKVVDSNAIYYFDVNKNIYHGVTDPKVFTDNNWDWDSVMNVESKWLEEFTKGENYSSKLLVNNVQTVTKSTSGYTFKSFLTIGSKGEEVKQLQLKLTELGYFNYSGGATGYFGSITKQAVSKFQQANISTIGSAPGFVGPGTRSVLNK